ncbi:hypothetical protein B0H21DRAFT_726728 [Amylocystis lapponica]|nr:hypothetical protein B0H21DRAFT_726728 [Amylocystis lapponica]
MSPVFLPASPFFWTLVCVPFLRGARFFAAGAEFDGAALEDKGAQAAGFLRVISAHAGIALARMLAAKAPGM